MTKQLSRYLKGLLHIRMLTAVDCYSRESVAIHVDHSQPSRTVTTLLDGVIAQRGAPCVITVDNGPEFTSQYFVSAALTASRAAIGSTAEWRHGIGRGARGGEAINPSRAAVQAAGR